MAKQIHKPQTPKVRTKPSLDLRTPSGKKLPF